jgi:hypothetical protein
MTKELPRPLVRVWIEFNRREGLAIVLPDDAPPEVLVTGTRICFYERNETEWRGGVAIVRRGEKSPWVADIEGTIDEYPEYKESESQEVRDARFPRWRGVPREWRRGLIAIPSDFNMMDEQWVVVLNLERTPPEVLVPGTRVGLECEAIVRRGRDFPWVAEVIRETVVDHSDDESNDDKYRPAKS